MSRKATVRVSHSQMLSRRGFSRAGRLAAIAVLAIELCGCDPYVKVSGFVRQPSGDPLAEVKVVLRTAGREPHVAKTGNDGAFDVGIVGADPRATYISFARDGFQPVEEVVGDEERRTMEVTLQPK
jgi:hypothetical protein